MSSTVALKLDTYTRQARALVLDAQQAADVRGHAEVEPIHLLYSLLEGSEALRQAVKQLAVAADDVLVEAELCLRRLPRRRSGQAYLSPRFLELLTRAEGEASGQGGPPVSVAHLLLATAQTPRGDARFVMQLCGLSAPALRDALSSRAVAVSGGAGGGERLSAFGRDLTWMAGQGRFDPIVGRAEILRRVLQVLARRNAHNPLLLGERGVGKDTIVRALATRIAEGDVPQRLAGRRILELDVPALFGAGASPAAALTELFAALRDEPDPVIVYLRNIEALLGDRLRSGSGHVLTQALRDGGVQLLVATDPASYRRWLEGSELAEQFGVIPVEANSVEQTVAVLRGVVPQYEAAHGLTISDPALLAAAKLAQRYLPFVQLPKGAIDLVDEAAARVLVSIQSVPGALDELERAHAVVKVQLDSLHDDHDPASLQQRAVLAADEARLAAQVRDARSRWQEQQQLLQSIADIKSEMDAVRRSSELSTAEAASLNHGPLASLRERLQAARARLGETDPFVRDVVDESDVAQVVAERTGVPVQRMLEAEADKLLHMEERVGARVIGQAEAVSAVSRAVRRSRVGLRSGLRPIGSFMFLGSSGVGKTELAKAIAEFLFDDEGALTRLDMSEFMEKHSVARLLGAPPGYVDSDAGGFLTEAVRRRPYSVVLLDEVEKAHPEVFDIMLQVLEDGRLTDARGRLAHFSDTVVIMTSNLGSQHLLDATLAPDALRGRVLESLQQHFRPEFLNRIDETVLFEPLGRPELKRILALQVAALRRLLASRGVELEISDAATELLVELGHEPAFGARPLRRVLQRHVQDPLAELLLRERGVALHVSVEVSDGKCVLQANPA